MSLISKIRTCINCGHQYIPKKKSSKTCPSCHGRCDQKGRGQDWRRGQKSN